MDKQREKDMEELAQLKFEAEMLSFAISRSRDIRTERGLLAHVEAGDLMDEVVRKMEALLEAERAYKGDAEDELEDEEA
jgi:hypothetical protein